MLSLLLLHSKLLLHLQSVAGLAVVVVASAAQTAPASYSGVPSPAGEEPFPPFSTQPYLGACPSAGIIMSLPTTMYNVIVCCKRPIAFGQNTI